MMCDMGHECIKWLNDGWYFDDGVDVLIQSDITTTVIAAVQQPWRPCGASID